MFKERGRKQEVGRFCVILHAALFVKIGISGDAVLLGPDPTTNGRIIDVGNGRHEASHGLIESVALPLLKHGHFAFRKIAGPEAIKHDHNDSLEGTFLVLALQAFP